MKIAVQLWSLKEYTKVSPDAALEDVKKAGFDGVEFAGGMYGLTAERLRAKLDALGLTVCGAHIGLDDVLKDFKRTAADAAALGHKNIVVPWLEPNALRKNPAEFTAKLNKAAALCGKEGLNLVYHNHAFEFENGENYLYTFADAVPALLFEPDIFWLKAAGLDFFDVAARLYGRIALLHVKELSPLGTDAPNPPLGGGISDTAKILKYAKTNEKIKWTILEVEKFGSDYPSYLKVSAKFMKDA